MDKRLTFPLAARPTGCAVVTALALVCSSAGHWTNSAAWAQQGHWAFQPPTRPPLPVAGNGPWGRTPVDAFIAEQHETMGLTPAPQAARHVLVRRVSLDLTGLPPSPANVQSFLADSAPDAYARLVERLLSSPEYGERWGRHWLDLARWAESDAYEANAFRPAAWRYRDYVVESFNQDKPYTLFLRQQIAGDEMDPHADENLIATGFLSAARFNANEEDKAVQRNEVLVDIVNAIATVTLGLTMNCAQCHDHKFDPLTLRDYYRFQGFFVQGQLCAVLLSGADLWRTFEAQIPGELDAAKKRRQQLLEALTEADKETLNELDKEISRMEQELQAKKPQTWAFYSPVTSPHRIEVLAPRGMYPLAYAPEELRATKPRLLVRGDAHRPGQELAPGVPEIFTASVDARQPAVAATAPLGSRSALVDWLTGPANPLLARVWVNYIWQQHFGRGIVATPGDFGLRGAKPSHPELLEWLATELVRGGWSTKHIHRLIVLSSTYCQASQPNERNAQIDPENQFLWRWVPRRLEAEAVRDAALAASGKLDPSIGGESVSPKDETISNRRSIYLRQARHQLPMIQALFDGPSANESCTRRHVSTVPLQPLYLLNSEFFVKQAEAFAKRVVAEAGTDVTAQIERAFQIALARRPETDEIEAAGDFWRKYENDNGQSEPFRLGQSVPRDDADSGKLTSEAASMPLVHFCHALLNLNEFVYLE